MSENQKKRYGNLRKVELIPEGALTIYRM